MKAKDIQVGHIYYVKFDPTEPGEFGKKHLAVVLKKNKNNITFVVIPLTSDGRGAGANKIDLGVLDCLPVQLQGKTSYAVYDQVRVASASRFNPILENNQPFDAALSNKALADIFKAIMRDLLSDAPAECIKEMFCN